MQGGGDHRRVARDPWTDPSLRDLPPARHAHPGSARLRPGRGADHGGWRGSRREGGPAGPAVRRGCRQAAHRARRVHRPDPPRPLHHQHGEMPPARESRPRAGRGRRLQPLPGRADRPAAAGRHPHPRPPRTQPAAPRLGGDLSPPRAARGARRPCLRAPVPPGGGAVQRVAAGDAVHRHAARAHLPRRGRGEPRSHRTRRPQSRPTRSPPTSSACSLSDRAHPARRPRRDRPQPDGHRGGRRHRRRRLRADVPRAGDARHRPGHPRHHLADGASPPASAASC